MTADDAPLIVEVISEGPHCVPCEYAISAVRFVAREYPGQVEVRVIETKRRKDAQRYLELCRVHDGNLPMPSVLVKGRLAFGGIPEPDEMRQVLNQHLQGRQS